MRRLKMNVEINQGLAAFEVAVAVGFSVLIATTATYCIRGNRVKV